MDGANKGPIWGFEEAMDIFNLLSGPGAETDSSTVDHSYNYSYISRIFVKRLCIKKVFFFLRVER